MYENNQIVNKSKLLALNVIKIYKNLKEQNEYILSKQIVRSGTSVGANVREAQQGFTNNEFIYKMSIALKEACETQYWLELLHESEFINNSDFYNSYSVCKECIAILTSIVKSKHK